VLFPTTDTTVLTLSRIQPELDGYAYVIPDPNTVETMVVKSKFYASLRGSGIAYPLTFDPEMVSLDTICQKLTFPMFIRPVQSQVFLEHFRGKGFVATSRSSLQYYLDLARRYHVLVLVQQIITGPTANGYIFRGYISRQGTPQVEFAAQKVLQPHMFANPSITITIPLTYLAKFIEPFLKYLEQQRFRGLFSAEVKRDARDGQLKLLEVNARSSGDNYIGWACGADDIYAAYLDASEMDVPSQAPYTLGIACIHEFTSLQALILQAYRGQLSKRALPWIHRRKYLRTVTRDDLRPVIIEVTQYLVALSRAIFS
jgi:predicted ATP-grasp superfamily ATP-dependent carboligase